MKQKERKAIMTISSTFVTFIHEFGGFQAVSVSLAFFCSLSLRRFSQSSYTHLQPAEETRAAVLLASGGQDLSSHAVQRLTTSHRGYLWGVTLPQLCLAKDMLNMPTISNFTYQTLEDKKKEIKVAVVLQ